MSDDSCFWVCGSYFRHRRKSSDI